MCDWGTFLTFSETRRYNLLPKVGFRRMGQRYQRGRDRIWVSEVPKTSINRSPIIIQKQNIFDFSAGKCVIRVHFLHFGNLVEQIYYQVEVSLKWPKIWWKKNHEKYFCTNFKSFLDGILKLIQNASRSSEESSVNIACSQGGPPPNFADP